MQRLQRRHSALLGRAGKSPAGLALCTVHGESMGRNLEVMVDFHGRLIYSDDEINGDHATAILGESVSDRYLSYLRDVGVSYMFVGSRERALAVTTQGLHDYCGAERLLLGGGGITNGQFLHAGLIDEISLLVYPGLDCLVGELDSGPINLLT